ncbi:uncharacterized protein LOC116415862 [Nasonia vitripennis]|uniref:Uncharacterized protein n=1 Tax=Nasonia vitripennis TaxID=7425 RepID=A0A7M7PZQ9_NASVI|nr:uncharacterized protein LOC116415862 [Nasonia vitripennis]
MYNKSKQLIAAQNVTIEEENLDNSKNDPTYKPHNASQSKTEKDSSGIVTISEVYDMEQNTNNKGYGKKYFCPYCKEKFSKLGRHLEQKHKDQAEVKSFVVFPKKSAARSNAIALIRNKGIVIHNSNFEFHKGKFLCARRPGPQKEMKSTALEVCPDCNGTYTTLSIKNHNCKVDTENLPNKTRELLLRGRQKFLHCDKGLSERMRVEILPTIQNEQYFEIIKSDFLILECGESFCKKYLEARQNYMICGYLRAYANFLIEIRKINSEISDFESVMRPHYYKDTCLAIKKVAGFSRSGFAHPGTATSLTMLIKKAAKVNHCDILMSKDPGRKAVQKEVEGYAKLCEDRFGEDINKIATTTYLKNKQNKQVELVSTEDINKLDTFLENKRLNALKTLNRINEDVEDIDADPWCKKYYNIWRDL